MTIHSFPLLWQSLDDFWVKLNLPDTPGQSLVFNTSQVMTGDSCAADLFWKITEFNNMDGDCCAHVGLRAAERYIQDKLILL